MDFSAIVGWFDARRAGYALPQPLYLSDTAFAFDLEAIFRRNWLLIGFETELRTPGDYLALSVGEWPVLVIRGKDGVLRAFHNSCRHRGSVLCESGSGNVSRLVCPYHRWTYGLDGKLLAAGRMAEDFDKHLFGLKRVHLATVSGAVFVCLADEPPSFDTIREKLSPLLAPHRLEHSKLAFQSTLVEYGNWKLVMENGRECYHCPSGHPELARTFPTDASAHFEANTRHAEAFNARMVAAGLPIGPEEEDWWQAIRFPLNAGMTSMTLDGQACVSKLMCEAEGGDIGSLRWAMEPNAFCHSTSDFTFAFMAMPVGPSETHVVAKWLVHEDAVEGVDYTIESLSDLWTRTNLQDKALVEANQRGVRSPGYEPGPYSVDAESLTLRFTDWYCAKAKAYLAAHGATAPHG